MKLPPLIARAWPLTRLALLLASLALAPAQGVLAQTDLGLGNSDTFFIPKGQSKLVERVVAWVGAEPITYTEVEKALRQYQSDKLIEEGRISERRLGIALERLIGDTLILAAAKKAEIKVSPETLDNRLQAVMEKIIKSGGGKEKLEASLAKSGQSVEKMRNKLREQMRREMTIGLAISSQIVLTTSDVTNFETERRAQGLHTESYNISHLFIPVEPDVPEERWQAALSEAKAVRLEAMREGDFADIAEKWAQKHAAIGARGGNMGEFSSLELQSLQPELARAIPALALRSSAPPIRMQNGIRSQNGVQVLYLENKTTARDILFLKRYEERRKQWVKELRLKTNIKSDKPILKKAE